MWLPCMKNDIIITITIIININPWKYKVDATSPPR